MGGDAAVAKGLSWSTVLGVGIFHMGELAARLRDIQRTRMRPCR